jgi:choline dehydrogenase-like flavoprotein
MPNITNRRVYDVCIVGSGAGGGMAAKVLTEAGADVVMLEAGPLFFSESDSAMFTWNYESPRRGADTPDRQFGEFDAGFGGWTLQGEPYTQAAGGDEWAWFRSRMLGGRTNHWGRISLRYGPNDFKRRSIDGEGDDWPIGYDDISPYYDRIDRLIGIFGSSEGMYNEPDGIFLPPPRPRCYELMIKEACGRIGVPCIPSRLSILTKPLNGRAACHYCGQCNRGCVTNSNFSSPSVLIRPAMETGRLTLVPNAMCREVATDDEGLATGVSYVDTRDQQEYQVNARVVVLAASTCETARLLLNSRSTRHPNGLANSSDVVGRYLMDTTSSGVSAFVPKLMDGHPHNDDGVGGMHIYVPWWLDGQKLDFLRGYHIELYGGRGMPGYGFMGGIHRYNGLGREKGGGGYGTELKDDYRRLYGSILTFSAEGETIARKENRCEINPDVVVRLGFRLMVL